MRGVICSDITPLMIRLTSHYALKTDQHDHFNCAMIAFENAGRSCGVREVIR
jgi:hypothetical protein